MGEVNEWDETVTKLEEDNVTGGLLGIIIEPRLTPAKDVDVDVEARTIGTDTDLWITVGVIDCPELVTNITWK